jgi:glucosamine--fructose-6-phosphate aminotransferase (isomerizing)
LVVGLGEGFTCISSDLPSILPLTRKIVRIQDGEIITLWAERIELRSVKDGKIIPREPEYITESMDSVQKGGYPHFMLKEIHEEPRVAGELLRLLEASPDVEPIVSRMASARHLYLIGCGTSYHACLLGSVYMARLAGRAAIPVLAPQFIAQYAPAVGHEDVGLFVTQSGETKDVLNALEAAQKRGMSTFGLVNVIGATLTKVTERCLPLACGYEISVPATKTFTNQVIAFLFLAMRMGKGNTLELAHIPELMEQTIQTTSQQIPTIQDRLVKWNDLYCLGYGATYPIALEGALKLKEITYAHCEGMLSTEFKHGPLSAVNDDYPVIFITGPEDVPLIVSGINEVTCRGGYAIAIGEEESSLRANANHLIVIPSAGEMLNPLLAVLPLQLLSYHMSVARGYDPDFPRNLSKTLTVD